MTETLLAWDVVPVACTRFCELPDLLHVGGTKDPDVAAIVALAPDLVVMCDEENREEDAHALEAAGVPVHSCSPRSVGEVASALGALAAAVGAEPAMSDRALVALPSPEPLKMTAFIPIWRRPWMSLAENTYGSSVLAAIGVANVFATEGDRYPSVDLATAAARRPDVVLAPSEPYPFGLRHVTELESVAPVVLVDGRDLFWWGERTPAAISRLHARIGAPPTTLSKTPR